MLKYKKYIIDLLTIAVPMIIGNMGHILTGATDVLIAAKYNINTLAAVAIANSILFTVFIVGLGFLSGISIVLANFRGEKKFTKKYFYSGLVISQILAFFTWLVIIAIAFIIPKCGFETILIPQIQQYMFITSFSMFGMFAFQAIKEFLQAHEIVNFPNIILLITVFINLILNIILVFGIGFVPELGVVGLALSTLFVRTFLAIALIIYTWKIIKKQQNNHLYDVNYVKKVLKVGLPIGIALLFEFFGFNIVTISVGRDAGVLAATHNILLTIVDAIFMIPLSVSSAIAIKVGFFNGAKDLSEIKKYSCVGVLISTSFMVCCAILFILYPNFFIGLFTNDVKIVAIALPIVSLFAMFSIADGFQIALGGILKGLEKTKQVTTCLISSYWLCGIPLGFYLAYSQSMSLKGFWIGLTVSLYLIGLLELILIFIDLKKYNINKK